MSIWMKGGSAMGNAAKRVVGEMTDKSGSVIGLSALQKLISAQNAPRVVLEEITPARAKELLALGGANRNISQRWVRSLATEIGRGLWFLDGNTIRISNENKLLDGQHRLSAIVLAEKPVLSFVAYGISSQAMKNIDRGRARTIADLFKIHRNLANPNRVAGVCGQIHALENSVTANYGNIRLCFPDAEQLYAAYKPSIEWVFKTLGRSIEPGIPNGGTPVLAAFVYFHAMEPFRAKVEKMAVRFKTGQVRGNGGDPAEALRRTCLNVMQGGRSQAGGGTQRVFFFNKTLRAVEAEIKGEKLFHLKIDEQVGKRAISMKQEVARAS